MTTSGKWGWVIDDAHHGETLSFHLRFARAEGIAEFSNHISGDHHRFIARRVEVADFKMFIHDNYMALCYWVDEQLTRLGATLEGKKHD